MKRIPVKYKGIPLMPMKGSKAAKLIANKKAKIKFDRKTNTHYLVLLFVPSDFNTQPIILGIDPGSVFDGFSVVSKRSHHLNIELIHRPKKGKNSIKSYKTRQAMNRRVRRSRLWHRPIRFDNRNKTKLAPTIKANVDYRKWIITQLIKIYPITNAIVEDVRFNHFKSKKGASFSHVELGKTELYNFIKASGLSLELVDGYLTKELRVNSFGADPKLKDKGSKHFNAHCIDSFVIASEKIPVIDLFGLVVKGKSCVNTELFINKKITFIEKIVRVRRSLTRTRKRYKGKENYYRLRKGGIKEIYENFSSKPNHCRVKQQDSHSNHPKQWDYLNNGFAQRFKCNTARYGGTTYNKSSFKLNEWINRKIE